MANRHRRARGGRNLGPNYSAPGSTRVQKEAESQREDFKKGGAAVGRAHGGRAKARGDRAFKKGGAVAGFEKGGSVWSDAASGIRGKKGFAGKPVDFEKMPHGELDTSRAGATETKSDAKHRQGHGGKAKHQYAAGGKVEKYKDTVDNLRPEDDRRSDRDWKRGGRARKDGGKCDDDMDED